MIFGYWVSLWYLCQSRIVLHVWVFFLFFCFLLVRKWTCTAWASSSLRCATNPSPQEWRGSRSSETWGCQRSGSLRTLTSLSWRVRLVYCHFWLHKILCSTILLFIHYLADNFIYCFKYLCFWALFFRHTSLSGFWTMTPHREHLQRSCYCQSTYPLHRWRRRNWTRFYAPPSLTRAVRHTDACCQRSSPRTSMLPMTSCLTVKYTRCVLMISSYCNRKIFGIEI